MNNDFRYMKFIYLHCAQHKLPVGLLAQLVERFTGIAEVMASNPVRAWIFSGPIFNYLFSSVLSCEDLLNSFLHRQLGGKLNSLFITWMVYLDTTYWLALSWLVSSVNRVLHRYRGGHGFKSSTGLNFFKVLFSTTSSVVFLAARIS